MWSIYEGRLLAALSWHPQKKDEKHVEVNSLPWIFSRHPVGNSSLFSTLLHSEQGFQVPRSGTFHKLTFDNSVSELLQAY